MTHSRWQAVSIKEEVMPFSLLETQNHLRIYQPFFFFYPYTVLQRSLIGKVQHEFLNLLVVSRVLYIVPSNKYSTNVIQLFIQNRIFFLCNNNILIFQLLQTVVIMNQSLHSERFQTFGSRSQRGTNLCLHSRWCWTNSP